MAGWALTAQTQPLGSGREAEERTTGGTRDGANYRETNTGGHGSFALRAHYTVKPAPDSVRTTPKTNRLTHALKRVLSLGL